jgi:uncharacterized protein YdaU (DUF1376 family)
MSKEIAPAFQFYAAEYLADEHVALMSMEDEGCYIHLMAYCWREGSIPSDLELLSKLCKGKTPSSVVLDRFDYPCECATRLMHPRLEIERQKIAEYRKNSSKGGKRSAHKRKHKKDIVLEQCTTDSLPSEGQVKGNTSSSSSSSISSSKKREKRSRIAPDDFSLSDKQKRWAIETRPDLDIELETEKFRNYEFRDGKSDWNKTWKNWILNARGNGARITPAEQPAPKPKDLPDGWKWQFDAAGNKIGVLKPAQKTA